MGRPADDVHIPESPRPARLLRILKRALVILAIFLVVAGLAALAGGLWLRSQFHASLPLLEGERKLEGLSDPVFIERDALGIPAIRASNRRDLALALGFLHAQDRFFQMDLLRRSASGEMSELMGAVMLSWDRAVRVHCFREMAGRVLEHADDEEREMVEAYASGVNQGLSSLGAKPFEYFLLREDPAPWRPEDTVLVVLAMYIDLQDEDGSRESSLGIMHDLLPGPFFEFLATQGTEWDAPLAGLPSETPPIPGPEVIDLRTLDAADAAGEETSALFPGGMERLMPGSNNWAVSGELTNHGGAILANDMHLALSLPNIWYRASMVWPAEDGSEEELQVAGITLPGTPIIVVGSNGHVAWGFTNSYGDWVDLVVLEPDPNDSNAYLTPDGPRRINRHEERIRVKGGDEVTMEVLSTIWGPVIDEDHQGRRRALRWVAHDEQAVNFELMKLEYAQTVDEAISIANRSGSPAQNFVAADSLGHIGWSILGMIPRRVGFDGMLPGSWADGTRRWDGWLEPEEYPRIVDPPTGRIWTANNRVVGGEMLRRLGDGGFALGARARQIRDRLLELDRVSERGLLQVQLDDRAVFLDRWRNLLLDILTPVAIEADPRRHELRRLVEETWTGRASVDSPGYRLVRAFHSFFSSHVLETLTAPCRAADPNFSPRLRQWEGPLWRLVTEKPVHLLDPAFESWNELLLATVDETLDYFTKDGTPLAERTWGQRNTVRVRHPISMAVPLLGGWLDMPALELPGASHMPRVQGVGSGASQRMVVSPGKEEQGILHMPGGQSGHPLSPHYGDAHQAWARGEATPFLPGPPLHTLRLVP